MNFCTVCGKRTEKVSIQAYDSNTGEQLFIRKCSNPCHPRCTALPVKQSFWEWVKSGFKDKYKTTCCNQVFYTITYD